MRQTNSRYARNRAMLWICTCLVLGGLQVLPRAFATEAVTPAIAQPPVPKTPDSAPPAPDTIPLVSPNQPPPKPGIDNAKSMELTARPAAILHGTATWDNGLNTLTAAFAKINGQITKAKLTATDAPLAVFLETSDDGFTYDAMVPLAAAPAATVEFGDGVKLGVTPAGKAVRFEHRAAYQDIDDTYEALTAWLDEKELTAQDKFVEEFLTIPKDDEDASLKVDIYVFLK